MSAYDYDMISRYVDGEMSSEELQNFEEQLQQDEELKKEVELYKEVNDVLKEKLHPSNEELNLRNSLDDLREKYFSEKPKAKIISFKRVTMYVAAAAAILLIFVFIWSPWKQNLFDKYASTEMSSSAERGGDTDSLIRKATVDFNDKKFTEAIPIFEEILKTDSADSYTHFYYAIALLQTDKIDQSRIELLNLYSGTSLFKYNAAFYMALSYLKENDKEHCKEWLNKIPADADVNGKAKELYSKL
jgi:hypothetical protein